MKRAHPNLSNDTTTSLHCNIAHTHLVEVDGRYSCRWLRRRAFRVRCVIAPHAHTSSRLMSFARSARSAAAAAAVASATSSLPPSSAALRCTMRAAKRSKTAGRDGAVTRTGSEITSPRNPSSLAAHVPQSRRGRASTRARRARTTTTTPTTRRRPTRSPSPTRAARARRAAPPRPRATRSQACACASR